MLKLMDTRSSLNSQEDFWPYLKSKSKILATFSSFIASGLSSCERQLHFGLPSSGSNSVLHILKFSVSCFQPSSFQFKCSWTTDARNRFGFFYKTTYKDTIQRKIILRRYSRRLTNHRFERNIMSVELTRNRSMPHKQNNLTVNEACKHCFFCHKKCTQQNITHQESVFITKSKFARHQYFL